jgi:hypothetical protein
MSQTVSIVLKLRDSEQSHFLEKYLRENMFTGGEVISYANLPDTEGWYEKNPAFKKLVKEEKKAKKAKADFIHKYL